MKHIIAIFLTAVACFPNIKVTHAQQTNKKEKAKEASIEKMIEAQDFVFKAQFVLPTRGRTRQLTSEYELKITRENIEAYLPFFGRAYSAPMNPSEGGIKFSSSDFDYKTKIRKKRGWEISINPKDTRDVRKLYLTVSTSGYASLRVLSTNRDPIAFNGYIQSREKER